MQLSKKYSIKGLKDITLPSKNIQDNIPKEYHDLPKKDSTNNCARNTEIDEEIEMNFQEISDADEIQNLEEEHVSNSPSKENEIYKTGYHQKDFSMGEQMQKDLKGKHYNEGRIHPWFQNQNLIVRINGAKSLPYKEFEKCLWQLYRKNKFGFLECNKCSKTMKLSHMKEHVEKHLVGLSFECKICGKRMNYSQQNRNQYHKYICHMKQKSIILPDSKNCR